MTAIAIEAYLKSARFLAYQLNPTNDKELDATGQDVNDYAASLTIKGWSTALAYRTKHPNAEDQDEIRYVKQAQNNEARNIHRKRARVTQLVDREQCVSESHDTLVPLLPHEALREQEHHLEVRESLTWLRNKLTPDEWRLAVRLGENYGRGGRLFDPELDTSASSVSSRVSRLRKKARGLMVQRSGMGESRDSN